MCSCGSFGISTSKLSTASGKCEASNYREPGKGDIDDCMFIVHLRQAVFLEYSRRLASRDYERSSFYVYEVGLLFVG